MQLGTLIQIQSEVQKDNPKVSGQDIYKQNKQAVLVGLSKSECMWVMETCVGFSPLSLSSVVFLLAQSSASLSLRPATPDAVDRRRVEEEEA